MDARINYVIPLWDGDRHQGMDAFFHQDRSFYLRTQLWQLATLSHRLSQITFVRCADSPRDAKFMEALARMPPKLITADIVLLKTKKPGWSYGAFAEAFEKHPNFDYYIFSEDDYTPVMSNFDQFLVDFISSRPDCGYACVLEAQCGDGTSFGSMPHGIMRKEALEANKKHHGRTISHAGQVDFGVGFWRAGWKVHGLCPTVRSPYWAGHTRPPAPNNWNGHVISHCSQGDKDLFVPVQMLISPSLSPWPVSWHSAPYKVLQDTDSYWRAIEASANCWNKLIG